MKVAWLLKNDPIRSNSSLVRAVRASHVLSAMGVISTCLSPPPEMSRRRWWELGVMRAACGHLDVDVVVLQKIWRQEVCEALKARGHRICFDVDDEYEKDNPEHRRIVEMVDSVVCSSGVCENELRQIHPRVFSIPCFPEKPTIMAQPPSSRRKVLVWTGYCDNIVEILPLKNVVRRLIAKHDAKFIIHSSEPMNLGWGEGVEEVVFDLETKDAVLAQGHVGISNKPLSGVYWRKTEDKVVTYMSYGIVPVCSPIPAYKSVIADDVNGFLVHPEDEDGWYQKLVLLLTSEEVWRRMSEAGRSLAATRYNWETIAKDWRDALEAARGNGR